MASKKLRALDLFAGAGGFSLGMEWAGFEVIAAIEFDKKIALTYQVNHPNTVLINEDIKDVAVSNDEIKNDDSKSNSLINVLRSQGVNEIDIIFGGPPCQGFSMAGQRIRKEKAFFTDERNKLFLEFYRMVAHFKPKIFIIENVPGILNYKDGMVKNEIEKKFSDLGYNVSSQILSAEKFGVPQKRKRAFFIGNILGIQSEDLFPKETNDNSHIVSVWDAIGDLPSLASGEGVEKSTYIKQPQNEYQLFMRSTIDDYFYNHQASIHQEKTIEILKQIKPGQTLKDLPKSYHTKSVHSGAYGRMKKHEPSYTLTTRLNTPSVGRITHPVDHRTITPREAARIQSFPDSYYFVGDITTVGIQIGNSVPPLLAKAIGINILSKAFKL